MGTLRSIAFTTVLLAGALPASAVEVGSVPRISGGIVDTRFDANPDLGRAWIEVTVRDPRLRDDSPLSEIVHQSRFKVSGLSFDPATSQIVLEKNDERIACADLVARKRPSLLPHKIRETGRCEIALEPVSVAEDDGFHIRDRHHIELRLKLPNNSTSES